MSDTLFTAGLVACGFFAGLAVGVRYATHRYRRIFHELGNDLTEIMRWSKRSSGG